MLSDDPKCRRRGLDLLGAKPSREIFGPPALAITGVSGFRMAGASADPTIARKRRRMPVIAANGIFVLIPAALYLAMLASRGEFGPLFYGVQAIELIAGAVNLTLMSLNIRDGLSLTANKRARRQPTRQLSTNLREPPHA